MGRILAHSRAAKADFTYWFVITNASRHHHHWQNFNINTMPYSSSQASLTSLAISRLPRSEAQNKYLEELAAEIIIWGNGVTNGDVNKATIFLCAHSKDAVLVCMVLFAVLIRLLMYFRVGSMPEFHWPDLQGSLLVHNSKSHHHSALIAAVLCPVALWFIALI